MKSIIQKASTIQKAVEDAWNAAGKPQEFSVRVLELPQKGFLGFTKHPAKIALVFEEQRAREPRQRDTRDRNDSREPRDTRESRDNRDGRHQQKNTRPQREQHEQREQREPQRTAQREQPRENREPRDQRNEQQKPEVVAEQRGAAIKPQRRLEGQWTEDLVTSAQTWLKDVLSTMDKGSITFTTEVQAFNLRITFSVPLTDDETKEKHLFASLSTLMMASLKREYRKALRGHKIIIAHA